MELRKIKEAFDATALIFAFVAPFFVGLYFFAQGEKLIATILSLAGLAYGYVLVSLSQETADILRQARKTEKDFEDYIERHNKYSKPENNNESNANSRSTVRRRRGKSLSKAI